MALKIASVNLYPLENSKAHRTSKFESVHLEPPVPVFRRGQEIEFDVIFSNRPYNRSTDKLRVVFTYEDDDNKLRSPSGGAWLTNNVDLADDPNLWSLRDISNKGNILKLKMKTPVQCAVGAWKVTFKADLRSNLGGTTYECPELIYILFNPWHKDDQVYMPDTHLLEEYVMNDVGKVYVGGKSSSEGRQWLFGQFEAHVLPICLKSLQFSRIAYNKRSDPVQVSRALTYVRRILVGNWSGEYDGGTNPSMWTGSAPILKEYSVTGEPVKYGQCWVYASLCCSVCRALGIPARVVTNVHSAQDYDGSLTVDKYYKANGELEERGESLWNFHAWIDVWMSRSDLPTGYGGWQALDPTMQSGPAPLEAIKRGEVGYEYDVADVISEVNSDLVDWKEDPESLLGYRKIRTDSSYVGYQMLTKRPHIFDPNGEKDRDDIMNQYKNREGSSEERLALLRAALNCSARSSEVFGLKDVKIIEEIKFKILDLDKVFIGKDFDIILNIENTVGEKRNVQLVMSLFSVYYNGIKAHTIKKLFQTVKLAPNERKRHNITITADDYLGKLVEFNLLKMYIMATVEETKQPWVWEDDFNISKPNLIIQPEGKLLAGVPGKIIFKFKNPIKKKLTECQLAFDCPGMINYQKTQFRDVLPEENIKIEIAVTPLLKETLTLVAIFYCKELHEIFGSAVIEISA